MATKILSRQVIIIPEKDGGYSASVPSLKGCHSQGDTWEETLTNIREAIELYIEDMLANGEEITNDELDRVLVVV